MRDANSPEIAMNKKALTSAAVALLLTTSAPVLAQDGAVGAATTPTYGLKLCFADKIMSGALLPQVGFVETAVIIRNDQGVDVVKANSSYGEKIVASYWTSALPRNVDLNAGCYTFFFMIKNSPPATGVEWSCATPAAGDGPVQPERELKYTTITGYIGAGVVSGVALLPYYPNKKPEKISDCPRGF